MARAESTTVGGFFKTSDEWLPHVANLFKPAKEAGIMLDPCAGEGEALQYLAKRWNMTPYAVEVDVNRAKAVIEKFGEERALNDDYFTFHMTRNSVAVQYLNPPYDSDYVAGNKIRQELRFLRGSWMPMAKGGFNIVVVYTHHVTYGFAMNLIRHSEWVDVYRMPSLHLGRYMQVVIVSKVGDTDKNEIEISMEAERLSERANKNYRWSRNEMNDDPFVDPDTYLWPRIDEAEEGIYEIPSIPAPRKMIFRPGTITDGMRTESVNRSGAHLLPQISDMLALADDDKEINPLMRPRMRQIGGLIGGGLFNGLRLKTDKGAAIVRSAVRQVESKVEEERDEKGNVTKATFRTIPETSIKVLYEDGELVDITGDVPMADFVSRYKDALVEYARRQFKAQYNFDFIGGKYGVQNGSRVYEAGLTEGYLNNVRIRKDAENSFELREPQKHVVSASFARLTNHKSVIMAAQMRTGKTAMTATLMDMMRYGQEDTKLTAAIDKPMKPGQFNVVICPPHLVKVWLREFKAVTPDAFVYPVASGEGERPIEAVKDFLRQIQTVPATTLKVLIISREMGKVGETWKPAYVVKRTLIQNPLYNPSDPESKRRIVVEMLTDPTTGRIITKPGSDKPMSAKMLEDNRSRFLFDEEERGRKKQRYGHIVDPNKGEYNDAWEKAYAHTRPVEGDAEWTIIRKQGSAKMIRSRAENELEKLDIENAVGAPLWQEAREHGKPFIRDGKSKIEVDPGVLLAQRMNTKRTKRVMPLPDIFLKMDSEGNWNGQYFENDHEIYPIKNPRAGLGGIAKYLAKYHADDIYMVAFDEFHELKDPYSAQGLMMGRLSNVATKVVAGTGTLYGGVASSLFALEFFTNPRIRNDYGWDGVKAWVDKMGVLETVIEYKHSGKDGRKSERKEYIKPPKEAPGASPELLAELVDHVIFFLLKDLGDAIPELHEEGRGVMLDDELRNNYLKWELFASQYNTDCLLAGDNSFLGTMFHASINYLNYPYEDYRVIHRTTIKDEATAHESVVERCVYVIPGIGNRCTPKENDLIKQVRQELAKGNGVAIFVNQTQKRNLHRHLEKVIKAEVNSAKVAVLTSSVGTSEREEWLDKKMEQGVNVLICNPNLVKTGLSLTAFNTIIFYETPASLYTVDQAAHRAIAMSQDKECKAIYYYNHIAYAKAWAEDEEGNRVLVTRTDEEGNPIPAMDTMEARLVSIVDKKRGAADYIYGEESASLSALTESSSSLMEEIAKSMKDGAVMDASGLFKKARKEAEKVENSFMDADKEEVTAEEPVVEAVRPALPPKLNKEELVEEVARRDAIVGKPSLHAAILSRFKKPAAEAAPVVEAAPKVERENRSEEKPKQVEMIFTPAQEEEPELEQSVGNIIRLVRKPAAANNSIFKKLAGL